MGYKIAADIGGTFTDIAVFLGGERLVTRKLPSTPDDYARGVVDGILALAREQGIDPGDVEEVLHGCTVATNAILEGKGARTALVTTRGFRDVLELRRIRVPRLYDPLYVKPQPLAPRNLRFEVTERLAADGSVLLPLVEAEVEAAATAIRRERAEAVAVCFLHSYANPAHERRAGEILRAALPSCFVTISADVLPEMREYERTSTTVINAYVGPPVARYIERLARGLRDAGIGGRLLVMQSGGGILEASSVIGAPARIVECGPAAGVIGAAHRAALGGTPDLVTFDMGGTTAKASLIEGGQITRTDEYEVGGGISLSSRLVKGGGYALKLPVIDISEVGAGGGSIVRIDRGGVLKVGPDSAGAVPGPACYGLGGTQPTVTDANVVLGFVNPHALAGGTVPIDAAKSKEVIADLVARPLDLSLEEAAWWVYVVATANMVRAVKAVSTYRGRNPADFTLMAFGGNGGIFAGELMRQLQMPRAIVPPAAGVFSAIGLLVADVQFNQTRAFKRALAGLDPADLGQALNALQKEVRTRLGNAPAQALTMQRAAMRYVGQAFELTVPVPAGALDNAALHALGEAFEREHEKTYGHRLGPGFGIEIVALDVGTALAGEGGTGAAILPAAPGNVSRRRAYFGDKVGWHDTPVIGRGDLGAEPVRGPLIVEEYEGTSVVPPDSEAWLGPQGDILMQLRGEG
jgi:N-methylhydantoinase A